VQGIVIFLTPGGVDDIIKRKGAAIITAKHIVVFQPSGKRGSVEEGKTLLEAAQELGVDIESVCGGKLVCGKCAVEVDEDSTVRQGVKPAGQPLSSPADEELECLAHRGFGNKYRLACSARVLGDVVVYVPEASRRTKQIIRKAIRKRVVPVKPAIRKYYVELSPANLDDLRSDAERLLVELGDSFGLENLEIDYIVATELPDILRQADWKATATVWMGREILRVEAGYVERSYGVAIDIGTTSVGGYLCDLDSGEVLATDAIMNPQVAYGEDVMSRITYAKENPGGLATLNAVISDGINTLLKSITAKVGIATEDISEAVIVGNTAMHHILLNLNPEYLAKSPYVPVMSRSLNIKGRELGIDLHKASNIHVLPIEAGFVGADNVGVLVTEEPYKQNKIMLVIDIGTNGELLLGNREKLFCASCAMGPALEGATIKFGMRAAGGAIEHVSIDENLEVRFKVIGNDAWGVTDSVKAKGICGSGIIDAVAEMVKANIVQRNGRFNPELKSPRLVNNDNGSAFIIARADETALGQDITVSLSDIRAVQLAKAAMYAGCKLLMDKLGITSVDLVVLAGAFGSHVSKAHTLAIGLFPDCDLGKVYSVGNSAGEGARLALLNVDKRREAEVMARKVEYVELATEPNFQKHFLNALDFPHSEDGFPHLASLLGDRAFPSKNG